MLFKDFQNELGQINTLLDEKNKEIQKINLELEQKDKDIAKKKDDTAELIKEKTKYEVALQEQELYRFYLPLSITILFSTGIVTGLLGAFGIANEIVVKALTAIAIFGVTTLGIIPFATRKDRQELKKIVDSSKDIDYKGKIDGLKKQIAKDIEDASHLRDQRQKLTEEKENLTNKRTYLVGSVTGSLLKMYRKENLDVPVASYEKGKYKVKTL